MGFKELNKITKKISSLTGGILLIYLLCNLLNYFNSLLLGAHEAGGSPWGGPGAADFFARAPPPGLAPSLAAWHYITAY